MHDIISIHFVTIHPQTPPAHRKRQRIDDDEAHPPLTDEQLKRMDIDAIRRDLDYTIPGLFLEIRKLKGDGNQHNRFSSFDYTGKELDDYAGSQLKMMIENDDGEYFSCFKHLKAHVLPMVSGLNLQVAEMRDHIHTYDKSILGAYGKLSRLEKAIASSQKVVDIDCIAGLKCSLDSLQNQVTRIATHVASLKTSQTDILTDIQQMKKDITAIEQERKGDGSFGFRDEAGYKRCRSEICMNYTEMKMYTMHTCYLDCIQEMMRGPRWWKSDMFQCHMNTFLQLALDGSIGSEEWLNCYKEIVNTMELDKVACGVKDEVVIPYKIHHLAKQLSLDAIFTTDEEKRAGHTMVSCDLTDCHYCDDKKKKTATLS